MPLSGELLADEIACADSDDELVPDRQRTVGSVREDQSGAVRELLEVLLGLNAPAFVPLLESLELDPEQRCLNLVEPAVVTAQLAFVAPALSVVGEHAYPLHELVVVGDHDPGVAERAEVLGRVQAVGRRV